jgi:hypothetical protein
MRAVFRLLKKSLKKLLYGDSDEAKETEANPTIILDVYIGTKPSAQNALDIFANEWSSKFPDFPEDAAFGKAIAAPGIADLFEDARMNWVLSQIGGCHDFSILELGPLEGGHTYMLDRAGAKSILAIESNTRAFLKCLIAKEVLNIKAASFVLGDFCEYLKDCDGAKYDLVIASGVLYHMKNPVRLIADISKLTDKAFFWTHYYDSAVLSEKEDFRTRFGRSERLSEEGFNCKAYKQKYQTALGWKGFCGGGNEYSRWLKREDIINCCKHFGFNSIAIEFDHPHHPHGPAFALMCVK